MTGGTPSGTFETAVRRDGSELSEPSGTPSLRLLLPMVFSGSVGSAEYTEERGMSGSDTAAGEQCEMPECASREDLKRCRGPEDELIQACSDCRSDWPRQLRVVETDGGEK